MAGSVAPARTSDRPEPFVTATPWHGGPLPSCHRCPGLSAAAGTDRQDRTGQDEASTCRALACHLPDLPVLTAWPFLLAAVPPAHRQEARPRMPGAAPDWPSESGEEACLPCRCPRRPWPLGVPLSEKRGSACRAWAWSELGVWWGGFFFLSLF